MASAAAGVCMLTSMVCTTATMAVADMVTVVVIVIVATGTQVGMFKLKSGMGPLTTAPVGLATMQATSVG